MRKYIKKSIRSKEPWFFKPLIIASIIYLAFKFINNWMKGVTKPTGGSTLSISLANEYANRIWNAVKGFGTDEDEIFNILRGITQADYNKIYNSFGQKWYDKISGAEGGSLLSTKLNLSEILLNELSTDELSELRLISPQLSLG